MFFLAREEFLYSIAMDSAKEWVFFVVTYFRKSLAERSLRKTCSNGIELKKQDNTCGTALNTL